MYPEQVAKEWDTISPTIEVALPPITDHHVGYGIDRMNKVLESILCGRLEVYLFVNEEKVVGVVSTSELNTVDDTEKQLLIYSLYGHKGLGIEDLKEGFELLRELAKGKACSHITAYTAVEGLKRYVMKLGGDASHTFLKLEV